MLIKDAARTTRLPRYLVALVSHVLLAPTEEHVTQTG
jgi:hypothetical protein